MGSSIAKPFFQQAMPAWLRGIPFRGTGRTLIKPNFAVKQFDDFVPTSHLNHHILRQTSAADHSTATQVFEKIYSAVMQHWQFRPQTDRMQM
jgi:hypothetical protein